METNSWNDDGRQAKILTLLDDPKEVKRRRLKVLNSLTYMGVMTTVKRSSAAGNIPVVIWDHCDVVCTLGIRVLVLLHSLSNVASRNTGLFQLLLTKLLLVTLEQWFCCLRCLAFGFPKLLDLFRCVKFVRLFC